MLQPLFVWQNKVLKRIDPQKVVALYTEGNYTKILFCDFKFYQIKSSLTRTVKRLPPDMFIKIDRKTVVSIYYIDDIDTDHLYVTAGKGGEEKEGFKIGDTYYDSLISKLNVVVQPKRKKKIPIIKDRQI